MRRSTANVFISETREHMISAAMDFCEKVVQLPGVMRVAFIGSICTDKPEPKDIDLLLTIDPSVEMENLAKLGRQLKGANQRINHSADIFLADPEGRYIGRTCSWRECRPFKRQACEALHCGRIQYLYDDLQIIELSQEVIANPPLIIHPRLTLNAPVPDDLLRKVRQWFEERTSDVPPPT